MYGVGDTGPLKKKKKKKKIKGGQASNLSG
jgi:hypothetical protein